MVTKINKKLVNHRLNTLSMGIIVSSFGKFIPIVTVIWDYSAKNIVSDKFFFVYKAWVVYFIVLAANYQMIKGCLLIHTFKLIISLCRDGCENDG